MQIGLSINTSVVNKAVGKEMAELNHNMQPVTITLEELAAHIKAGHPFTPAYLKARHDGKAARNNAAWVSARLVAIDIDNSVDSIQGKRRRTAEEGYVALDDLLRDENIRRQAAMIYTSPSHTDEWHRLRVLFILHEVILDPIAYKRIIDAFIDRFDADTAASAISNLFYGSKDCTMHVLGNICEHRFLEDTVNRLNAVQAETRHARMYIANGVPAVEEVRKMLHAIPHKMEYLDWMRIVSAIGNSYPEDVAYNLINDKWPEMPHGDVAYKLRNRLHRIGIGTLIYQAKKYGWNPPVGMYDDPPKPKEALKHVEKYLQGFYKWRFNVVRNQVEYASADDNEEEFKNFDDYALHSVLRELRAEGINVSKERVVETVMSNFSPSFDPIKTYFNQQLAPWDQVDRVEELAKCIPIPDDDEHKEAALSYNAIVLGKWMASAVACGLEGKANHICPILQGPQGAYKTTFILGLCPSPLRRYLTVGTITGDKDTLDQIARSFIFVDDELATMNKKEAEIMKRIITQEDIMFRPVYGRFQQEHQRRASFIGSVNKMTFLADETGSRRFPVIRVGGKIDMARFRKIDVDQLWAQALHEYRDGDGYWFVDDEIDEINLRNQAHQMRTDAEDLLAKYCQPVAREDEGKHGVVALSTTDVAAKLASAYFDDYKAQVKADGRFVTSLGKALAASGYVRFGKKRGKSVTYVWLLRWG